MIKISGQETSLDFVPDAGHIDSNRMRALPQNLMAESAGTSIIAVW